MGQDAAVPPLKGPGGGEVSVEVLLLLLAFAALLVVPLLPGALELWRRRDAHPIEIDQDGTINPREPGLAFRQRLRPLLDVAESDLPFQAPLAKAGAESYEVHRQLRLAAESRAATLVIALGDTEVGDRGRLGDLWVQGHARVGTAVRLRALAADGDLVLGPDGRVENWIDTEASAWIGARCDLGRSAAAAKGLNLGAGCTFRRLWGLPVSTEVPPQWAPSPAAPADPGEARVDDAMLWAGGHLTVPSGFTVDRDLVVHGEVRIAPGNVVRGSIKAYKALHLGEGVQVEGNLICRQGIHIAGAARIRGNVYAEGDVVIGPGTRIGDAEGFKSVYAGGRIELAPDVVVFGSVVAERTGSVGSAPAGAPASTSRSRSRSRSRST